MTDLTAKQDFNKQRNPYLLGAIRTLLQKELMSEEVSIKPFMHTILDGESSAIYDFASDKVLTPLTTQQAPISPKQLNSLKSSISMRLGVRDVTWDNLTSHIDEFTRKETALAAGLAPNTTWGDLRRHGLAESLSPRTRKLAGGGPNLA